MTLIFEQEREGPATHAFVMGVGEYSHSVTGNNGDPIKAPNIASAADSAKLMCDWLLANRDNLAAPLASLEVLISDPPEDQDRYQWAPLHPVEKANEANLRVAGKRWLTNFKEGTGHTALFYACGHGASLTAEPVVFLDELYLNSDEPWPNVHAASLARSLRKHSHVGSAYIFVDACGEQVPAFEQTPAEHRQAVIFYPMPLFGKGGGNKVMLLSAAPEGVLAYDAPLSPNEYPAPYAGVKIGRFTQTLIKALNGASVRTWKGKWAVNSTGLRDDLKRLQQFYYPAFEDFEPTPIYGFNEVRPFAYPAKPVVPIVATTNPAEALGEYQFCISHETPQPANEAGEAADLVRKAWFKEMAPRDTNVFAVAFNASGSFYCTFTPNQPQFELQVDIE